MKKIKGYNIVKEKTNELLVSIEIGNDEVIEKDGYKVIPLFEEIIGNPTIEQNAEENRIGSGVLSLSVAPKELNEHCKWCKGKSFNCGTCLNKDEENSYYLLHREKFPDPQERTFRPFKNCDELIEVYQKKYKSAVGCDIYFPSLYKPCIWIRDKTEDAKGDIELITGFTEHGNVLLNGTSYPLQHLFQMYEFLDGSPCGVEE